MGLNKMIFNEMREKEEVKRFQKEVDNFFDPKTLTLDVRIRFKIPIDVLDSIVDKRLLKADIRKKMFSQFRKELTKELIDKI